MKRNYPAEAFALGIILFSTGMKEAFTAGILVILSVTFAEFLRNLLLTSVPGRSLRLCVFIAAASLSASVFLFGFAALGSTLSAPAWIMCAVIGLLCAKHVLSGPVDSMYSDLLFESAVAWGFWIFLAIIREFMGNGMIFGNSIIQTSFQSKAFLGSTFSFLAAGLTLAFTNGILKTDCKGLHSLFVFLPAAVFVRPFTLERFGGIVSIAWTILVPSVLFLSIKKTLQFSRTGKAYRGLPADMLAAGFIYMILSIY